MLLPASSANPTGFIAQALTMYKSLFNDIPSAYGNVKLTEAKDNAPAERSGNKGPKVTKNLDLGHNGKSVFSLQSPSKDT